MTPTNLLRDPEIRQTYGGKKVKKAMPKGMPPKPKDMPMKEHMMAGMPPKGMGPAMMNDKGKGGKKGKK